MTTHIPQQQISAWIDRQLSAEEAARTELHLRECESCRRFQEELSSADALFRTFENVEPPAYLWTRVAAQLDSPLPGRFAWLRWGPAGNLKRREILATAAALIIILGGGIFALVEQKAAERFQLNAVAQLDSIHAVLAAKDTDRYNPFHTTGWANPDSNPFTRQSPDVESNPFGSLREKH